MKNYLKITALIILFSPIAALAQNSVKKATAPKAAIVLFENGQESPLKNLQFNKDNKVKITVNGGVQNIRHKVIVTSTNAEVKHLQGNEYLVKPVVDEKINLIVDIQTYEDYFFYQHKAKGKKQKIKKVLTTFPPEKYMVSYETIDVQKL